MPTERITTRFDKGMMLDAVPFDIPDGYAQNIKGALITEEGMISPALSNAMAISGVSTQIIKGIIEVKAADGTLYWVYGTSDGKLWRTTAEIGSLAATDVSKTGTYANTEWSFAQYGDWVIATNGVDNPQIMKGIATGTFVDLAGSPPKGKYVYLDNGHLIFANIGTTVTVTNGTFTASATAAWTIGAGWEYSANAMYKNSDGAGALQQNVSAVAGNTYKVNFDISAVSANAWTERTLSAIWADSRRIAISNSGTYQLVTTSLKTLTYRSTNSGVSWNAHSTLSGISEVDMSTEATVQYALGSSLMKSTDFGSAFAALTITGVGTTMTSLACTGDGTKIAVTSYAGSTAYIHLSTDSGSSWSQIYSVAFTALTGPFDRVYMSKTNGSTIVAIKGSGLMDNLYISTDSGVTWNTRSYATQWGGVAISDDGTKIYAAPYAGTYIQKSTDSGATWVPKNVASGYWGITCSGDGTKVTALGNLTNKIYVSNDSGETWEIQGATKSSWRSVGMSDSGNKQTAAWRSQSSPFEGTIYTYDTSVNTLVVGIGGVNAPSISLENKSYEVNLASTGTGNLTFTPASSSRFVLDNVTVQITGLNAKKAQWSAYENIEDYAASLATGAGSQIFYEADGNIVGIARLGTRFIILFDNSLQVGQYIGGSYTFGFQKPLRGCTAANEGNTAFNTNGIRWTSVGDNLYFMGTDDIYATDGNSIKNITKGNRQNFFTTNRTIHASVISDIKNKTILFSKYDLGIGDPEGVTTYTHRILAYNYETGVWSHLGFVTDASYTAGSFPRLVNIVSNETVDRVLLGYIYKDAAGTIQHRYWDDGSFGEVVVTTKELGNGIDVITCNRVKPVYHLAATSYPLVVMNTRMDERDATTATSKTVVSGTSYYDNIATGSYLSSTITWKGPASFDARANLSGCIFIIARTGAR